MLKLRILTAAILIPLMVWATYALSTPWLGALFGVFILAAAWEWTRLCGLSQRWVRILYISGVAGAGLWLYYRYIFGVAGASGLRHYAPMSPLMLASAAWWLLALFEMVTQRDARAGLLASGPGRLISGFFVLVPAWIAPLWLHAHQPQGWKLVLFMMVLVWTGGPGAYFVGKPWGKTKIVPHISPGKSLEGVLGGLAAVTLVAWLSGVWVWQFGADKLWTWVMLAMVVALVSVVGDLVESRFKRAVGVKDSGNLLPGHGGVLDRIDAFTAAAPFFVLGWLYSGLAT